MKLGGVKGPKEFIRDKNRKSTIREQIMKKQQEKQQVLQNNLVRQAEEASKKLKEDHEKMTQKFVNDSADMNRL